MTRLLSASVRLKPPRPPSSPERRRVSAPSRQRSAFIHKRRTFLFPVRSFPRSVASDAAVGLLKRTPPLPVAPLARRRHPWLRSTEWQTNRWWPSERIQPSWAVSGDGSGGYLSSRRGRALRRGELIGLESRDLDRGNTAWRVVRSLEETKAALVLKAPKTAHSVACYYPSRPLRCHPAYPRVADGGAASAVVSVRAGHASVAFTL